MYTMMRWSSIRCGDTAGVAEGRGRWRVYVGLGGRESGGGGGYAVLHGQRRVAHIAGELSIGSELLQNHGGLPSKILAASWPVRQRFAQSIGGGLVDFKAAV
ncbi:hypothetical protein Tco_0957272 [Tanacetum coccineum]